MNRLTIQEKLRALSNSMKMMEQEIAKLITDFERNCGCSQRGPHRTTCRFGKSSIAQWDGWMLSCCGSRNRSRHKISCSVNNSDGKLPPDLIGWRCVDCSWSKRQDDRPEQCGDCGSPLLIQVAL